MTLSQLDLQLIEYSDQTLKLGCVLFIDGDDYDLYIDTFEDCSIMCKKCDYGASTDYDIIGSPFGWGRVCYLFRHDIRNFYRIDVFEILQSYFNKNPELYDMDCLSWDEETKKLVLDFLNSLFIKK